MGQEGYLGNSTDPLKTIIVLHVFYIIFNGNIAGKLCVHPGDHHIIPFVNRRHVCNHAHFTSIGQSFAMLVI